MFGSIYQRKTTTHVVNKKGKVRRSRIFYFRGLTGKKARIKEIRG